MNAIVIINDGEEYTNNNTLHIQWSGFFDETSGIAGCFYSLEDHGGTENGIYTTAREVEIPDVPDQSS